MFSKAKCKLNFSADLTKESPETATYTYNGITNPLTSGSWLNQGTEQIKLEILQ